MLLVSAKIVPIDPSEVDFMNAGDTYMRRPINSNFNSIDIEETTP